MLSKTISVALLVLAVLGPHAVSAAPAALGSHLTRRQAPNVKIGDVVKPSSDSITGVIPARKEKPIVPPNKLPVDKIIMPSSVKAPKASRRDLAGGSLERRQRAPNVKIEDVVKPSSDSITGVIPARKEKPVVPPNKLPADKIIRPSSVKAPKASRRDFVGGSLERRQGAPNAKIGDVVKSSSDSITGVVPARKEKAVVPPNKLPADKIIRPSASSARRPPQ
ncbi:hypothetical protein HK102_000618 [Quaeritorhiza haematococci]|nr:hypothetical protein HK102_000618 [Quaeritorhiza haematococci]